MPNSEKLPGKIVKQYLLKFPNLSKLALARKIFKEQPLIFSSVDTARTRIRYFTGSDGEMSRVNQSGKDFREQLNALKKELPKGEIEQTLPYHLPSNIKRVLMLSDIHIPYQSDDALYAAINFGIEKDVDCVWLNGDLLDMYSLSRFEKDPRKRGFKYEIDCMKVFLKGLRNIFPKALILYKIGNHEVRWEAYMKAKAPEILDFEEFRLSELLDFRKLEIIEIKDKQLAYCGELKVMHYHELPLKSGGVNPARAVFLKTGESVIGGHYHRKSEHVERTLSGKLVKVYSTGCLCGLTPEYMPYNNWSHGFAYIELLLDGKYRVDNKTIIEGAVY